MSATTKAPAADKEAPAKDPKAFADPEARGDVAADAWRRNQRTSNKPAPQPSQFQVSYNGESKEITAVNEREAWAKFCDAVGKYPSPKSPGIEIKKL